MTPERWQRIQSLFDASVDLDAVARRRFLAVECGVDDALRLEVERLLRAEREIAGVPFIESAISDAASELVEPGTRAGDRLDEYRLTREIGRGGMGAVWLAERADGEYSAQVAIKVVSSGLAGPDVERRFRAERQILADLAHPNIARLVDGGSTPAGLPYIVMEFVDGLPITTWAERQRLGLRDRLDLFRTVCDAVQHAHASLIVHRDLKPSNILVRSDGTPKLVDFGIAKLLSPMPGLQETLSMIRLLTPSYASPEQLGGERVTVAADIWALGVLLFELLSGQHPFAGPGVPPLELRRRIVEEEPLPPSAVPARADSPPPVAPRSVRGDLDTIALHALHKDPEQRYASVAELAEDIRRFQDGLPVQARADSWRYLARRLIRRNAIAFTLLLSLTLSAIALGVSRIARLERERDAARADARRTAAVVEWIQSVAVPLVSADPIAARIAYSNALASLDSTFSSDPSSHALALDLLSILFPPPDSTR